MSEVPSSLASPPAQARQDSFLSHEIDSPPPPPAPSVVKESDTRLGLTILAESELNTARAIDMALLTAWRCALSEANAHNNGLTTHRIARFLDKLLDARNAALALRSEESSRQ